MDIKSRKRRGKRVSLEAAIPGALRKNQAKLGPPDGPVGDFIRLIKLKRHYVDGGTGLPTVEWVDEA
jgi:hypothetical protein